MSLDMHAGMSFEFMGNGADMSVDMTQSSASSLALETSRDMGKDVEIDQEITCSGKVGKTGGVGLWQFVVDNGDSSVWTYTSHTVCRYGELYD